MPAKPYRVSGTFRMGHVTTPFTIETIGADPNAARDRVLSTIGSRHRVDRHHIEIKDVKEIKNEEVSDPAILKMLSMVK